MKKTSAAEALQVRTPADFDSASADGSHGEPEPFDGVSSAIRPPHAGGGEARQTKLEGA